LAAVEEADNGDRTGKMKEPIKPTAKAIFINGLVHLALFGITGYISLKSFEKGIVLFSWHPSFMVIGVSTLIFSFDDVSFLRTRIIISVSHSDDPCRPDHVRQQLFHQQP
jgi:hypothetical protein